MAAKFGIKNIIVLHFTTYQKEDNSLSIYDWITMVLLPLALSLYLSVSTNIFSSSAYNIIVTAGAIFTGLLLNLLILIYDQKTKLISLCLKSGDKGYEKYSIRKRVINEVHYNISYSIIVCLMIIVLSVIGAIEIKTLFTIPYFDYDLKIATWLVNFPLLSLCIHQILTILSILKRVHQLIVNH